MRRGANDRQPAIDPVEAAASSRRRERHRTLPQRGGATGQAAGRQLAQTHHGQLRFPVPGPPADHPRRPAGIRPRTLCPLRAGVLGGRRRVQGGRRTGSGRDGGGLAQQGQGVLQHPRVGAGHRAVLPPRHHAARLRGTPRPSPDHAAGLHPQPARRLPAADEPDHRLHPQRMATAATVPVLPVGEASAARPRRAGVRRRRTGPGVRPVDARLQRHRARRAGGHPCQRARRGVGPRTAGPEATGTVLPRPAARPQARRRLRSVHRAGAERNRRRAAVQRRRHRQPHDLHVDGRPRHQCDRAVDADLRTRP